MLRRSKRSWGLFGGWLVIALQGCTTVGPEYEEPALPWLQQLETELYGAVMTATPEGEAGGIGLDQWWRQFDDPVLNQLVEIARADNPNLQIAGLRILESRALVTGADALSYPQQQTLAGSVVEVRNDSSRSSDGLTRWDATLSAGWELDFWGRFKRAQESADAAFMASIAAQRDAQVLLVAQVVDTYWRLRIIESRLGVLQVNIDRQYRSLEITQQLFDAGQQSELDLQQARTQYLSTKASLPALLQARAQLCNAIALLLGRPPGAIDELGTPGPIHAESMRLKPIAGLPASLLQQRPDVRASLWQVAAQSAQIGLSKAEYYPTIAVGGQLSWNKYGLPFTDELRGVALGPAVSWSVFDWGRIASGVQVQDARLQQLIEAYRQTVLAAAREVGDAMITIDYTSQQQDMLLDTVEAAERSLVLAQIRYREGYTDFQRVLDAQRSALTQADRKLQTDGAYLSAVVAFYKALGGGWQPDQLEVLVSNANREAMLKRTDWSDVFSAPLDESLQPTP